MTDAPERIWLWRDEPHGNLVVSTPSDPYPSGSVQYIHADLHQQALAEVEARGYAGVMIFVFGSNLAGIHGAGAARYAVEHHGAEMGVGEGLTGNSYALPTKDERIRTRTGAEVRDSIHKFCDFARENPEMTFAVTPVGTGLAGFDTEFILQCFKSGDLPSNCYMTSTWVTDA